MQPLDKRRLHQPAWRPDWLYDGARIGFRQCTNNLNFSLSHGARFASTTGVSCEDFLVDGLAMIDRTQYNPGTARPPNIWCQRQVPFTTSRWHTCSFRRERRQSCARSLCQSARSGWSLYQQTRQPPHRIRATLTAARQTTRTSRDSSCAHSPAWPCCSDSQSP